ncbi:TIGR01841 family phasin [uncultured Sphingomonas sp.]|uniref:phasin family protein n=1 Tax=uncultured Sphingomonas sp. TaxID=158754 RepID=UPI0035C96AD9
MDRKAKPVATPVVPVAAAPVSVAAKPVVPEVSAPVAKQAEPQSKLQPVVPAAKPVAKKPVPAKAPVRDEKPTPARIAQPTPARIAQPINAVPTATAAKDVTMDTIKTMTEKTQAMFAGADAKGAMEKGQKMFDEMNSFSKGNIEAIVESTKIAAKGFESLGQDVVAYAKKSFEEATTAAKTMASVKSPTEFMKLQSDYVRSAFDMMVAETSRSTETMLKLAGEVAQPISNRVAIAAEKVKIAA